MSDRNAKIIDLWRVGKSGSQIAAELGCTKAAVIAVVRRARENGIDVTRRPRRTVASEVRLHELKITPGFNGARARTCQWIEAEPARADSPKCGQPVKHGSSYCPAHHARCWRPLPQRIGVSR